MHKAKALLAHVYTASGLLWAYLLLMAILEEDWGAAGIWMLVALLVDSTDGVLARRVEVARSYPHLDGARLDDIVDFVNYTFLPLFLMMRAGWLPDPGLAWVIMPATASLFAFVRLDAKEVLSGFFRGFPSYWNVLALYWLLSPWDLPGWLLGLVLQLLGILCLAPVWFIYPSRSSRWAPFLWCGGALWMLLMVLALFWEGGRDWMIAISLIYPVVYLFLSLLARWKEPG